jgi:hypothetical protein
MKRVVRRAKARGWPPHAPKPAKVFWFFFSKKNCFLSYMMRCSIGGR